MHNFEFVTNQSIATPNNSLSFSPPPTPLFGLGTAIGRHVAFAISKNSFCFHPYDHLYAPISASKTSCALPRTCMRTVPKVPIRAPLVFDADAHCEKHANLTSSNLSLTPTASYESLSVQPLSAPSVPVVLNSVSQDSATADASTQFEKAIQSNIDSSSPSISLGTVYPEFKSCNSMAEVIQLSSELAPCSFDITKAQAAHKLDPKSLNADFLEADLLYAQTYGLQALLTSRFRDAEKITLQPAIISSDFMSVITFKNLQTVAVNGVVTETHSSFIPNLGVDCPTYPIEIADPEILIDHLQKLHRSGQFILLPMHIIKALA
jgi:hypothetical protein